MRTVDMIQKDLKEVEKRLESGSVPAHQRSLYSHMVTALKTELQGAEARRDALKRVAGQ